jgi:hypothetical protein
LLGLFFDPENGVGSLSTYYTDIPGDRTLQKGVRGKRADKSLAL